MDYAITFDANPNTGSATGCYNYLQHGFDPGFRIRARKIDAWCGWDVSGSYTYYWSKANDQVTRPVGGQIFSTLNHGGINLDAGDDTLIRASHNIRYQTFDALFHYAFDCFGPCHSLIPFWGIEGLKLEQDTFSHTDGDLGSNAATFDVNWDSELLGLGIKLGTDYEYRLLCGLSWFTRASFTVLAGQNESNNKQTLVVQTTPTTYELIFKTCDDICVPGCHLAAGLSYEKDCGCVTMRARVGYEFLEWWNVPRIRRFFQSGEEIGISTASNGSNLGLHGLFVGFDVGY